MFVRPALELIVKRIFWVVKVKDAVLPQSPFHCSSVRRRGTADSAPVFFFFYLVYTDLQSSINLCVCFVVLCFHVYVNVSVSPWLCF